MLTSGAKSAVALICVAAFVAALLWIDRTRVGPATTLTRCNLALARAELPAADILLIGSSRSGVALDPVALQSILRAETTGTPTVDRIAIGNITLRVSDALFRTYLQRRGAPSVVVLETTFMTPRTIARLERSARGRPSEHYLLTRDLNLMTFGQLMTQPAVAMPYTEPENAVALWQMRLRGVISRAGALLFQFAGAPLGNGGLETCDKDAFTREESWPRDFSFAYDDYRLDGPVEKMISDLRADLAAQATDRQLQDWQKAQPTGRPYPYDFGDVYRRGEMTYFTRMVDTARATGAQVIVLPMPLYGYEIDNADTETLERILPPDVQIVDLYALIGTDFSTFWYDDAHIEKDPTGVLTTALLAEHLAEVIASGLARD